MKIAVFSTKPFDRDYFSKANQHEHQEFNFFEASLNAKTVRLAYGHDAVCVFVNDQLDEEVMEMLAEFGVKLIALRCAGFNNVDLKSARKYDIKVVRVPQYSPHSVAEHAVALLLTLNRKTHKAYNRVREHNFSVDRLIGFELAGKTVGVIGTGNIGSIFCRIMHGFGCKVLAFDLHASRSLEALGVTYCGLDELLQAADIVSLHCPLNDSTRHLIRKERLEKMKPGAMLINTSRGALIRTEDVIAALKRGTLGALAIDVYEQEEHLFFKDLSESIVLDDMIARLLTFPNVLITSHQGFLTREALEEITLTTWDNIEQFRSGKQLDNAVSWGES